MIDGYSLATWFAQRLAVYLAIAFFSGVAFVAVVAVIAWWQPRCTSHQEDWTNKGSGIVTVRVCQ